MSAVQNIAKHVLPERVFRSMQDESQTWLMRCPCGHETSVWEMGGIRWKADGKPIRWGQCGGCGERFFAQVYRHATNNETQTITNGHHDTMTHMTTQQDIRVDQPGTTVRFWIDGVGCWLLSPTASLTLGGPVEPGSSKETADVCMLSNLSRLHATLTRVGESYQLQTEHGEVNGRPVRGETYLKDGDVITLGQNVRMKFRLPSVLSTSAVLLPDGQAWPRMFSGKETPGAVDGIVLMDEVALLGPGSDAHVPCADWDEKVILHRRDGQLCVKSAGWMQLDGHTLSEGSALGDGMVVSGDGWRFRAEVVGA